MARIARLVIPDYPHHVLQRGNRRQTVFFNDQDKATYIEYLKVYAKPAGIEFWAYCLMDNHVHLIAVPKTPESFAQGFAEAHRRYTRMVNFREKWRGYLWEGRFRSYPMHEIHLYAAMRYIERNPVRAGIVSKPWDYQWSSARAHSFNLKDALLSDNFVTPETKDWKQFLEAEDDTVRISEFRKHSDTGRPLGDKKFIELLEGITGRIIRKQKTGPKVIK